MSENSTTNKRLNKARLIYLVFAGGIGLILLTIGLYQLLSFTESTEFCGELCHKVMHPEYVTYQASPHSRVHCTECHVGPGASYLVQSKLSGLPQMVNTLFDRFHTPIPTPVENLRPARDTCEECHWPEKFSEDRIRTYITYEEDEENTRVSTTIAFKVGGGESHVARDIHWHIANNVWYLPLDEKRQEIAWVGLEDPSGELIVYTDLDKASKATPERVEEEKRLMDCVDCHNRATHIFYSPEELMDAALTQNKIDTGIPYIKREAMEALVPANSSLDEALAKVESIEDFYRESYPMFYQDNLDLVEQALVELEKIATLTTFPEWNLSWETHLNNSSHDGCYRCHGRLVATSGDQKGELVSGDCDVCHYEL
jgi:nitrate/TMAO reductase-like tetraheme cytochrome c subunit